MSPEVKSARVQHPIVQSCRMLVPGCEFLDAAGMDDVDSVDDYGQTRN